MGAAANFDAFLGKDGGADAVKLSSKNPGFEVGVYTAKINRCISGEARGTSTFYFVAEMEILTSDNAQLPKGTVVAYYLGFDNSKTIELRKRQLLEFIVGAGGLTLEEAKVAWTKGSVWGPDQIFADAKVNVVVREAIAKESKKPYRAFKFTSAE